MFALTHPDQVDSLPAVYADWCLQFDGVEQAAADERQARMQGG